MPFVLHYCFIFFSGWWRNHSYIFIFEMTLVINRVRHLASSCCWNCGVCDLPTSFDSRGLRRATKNPSRLDSEMAGGSCSKQGDSLSCSTWWIYTGQKEWFTVASSRALLCAERCPTGTSCPSSARINTKNEGWTCQNSSGEGTDGLIFFCISFLPDWLLVLNSWGHGWYYIYIYIIIHHII